MHQYSRLDYKKVKNGAAMTLPMHVTKSLHNAKLKAN